MGTAFREKRGLEKGWKKWAETECVMTRDSILQQER